MDKKMLVIGIALMSASLGLGGYLLHQAMGEEGSGELMYDLWINSKRDLLKKDKDTDPTGPDDDPSGPDPQTRAYGGDLKWKQVLFEGEGQPTSSPSLVDLNNDGDLEVVIASAGDLVYALTPDGGFYWDGPYSDDVIDYLGQTTGTSGLDFEPPHIFSSVMVADVNLGDTPEIILGVKDGALCIGADGEKQWRKGLTTGYYFSTACITDLEGEWTGDKEDLEIVMASDDESRRGWLEAFEVDGGAIFREEVTHLGEGGLMGCSVVAADLDGDFWDGTVLIDPDPSKERDTELILGNHDRGFRVWSRQGEGADGKPNYDESFILSLGHQSYATTAVANITGGPGLESIVALSVGGAREWQGWSGELACVDQSGKPLWKYSLSSRPSSIFSSPAIADLQMSKLNPHEEHLDYEIIFGADDGRLYVLDAEEHNLLWSFDTGGRILSSPAICNIDNDGEAEIIIGSDSGKVFCFDGDPSDGIDDGISYPGDGLTGDVLWVYDTVHPVGISSPVVADIDLDGSLEVVIGDSGGHVYCISAGGRSLVGQEDWPQFHNDINRTGFFNPQTTYGVDIYPKMDEHGRKEITVKSTLPGMKTTYNLTVENIGMGQSTLNRDLINVQIEEGSIPAGWSAWLDTPADKGNDNPGHVRLASQETADLTLHVYAPWEGAIGEMARINVTVNSSKNPFARDSITTLTVLELYVEMDLQWLKDFNEDPLDPLYGKKKDTIPPGRDKVYSASVHNKGNLNDTYRISLSHPPKEAGWDWYFIETGTLEIEMGLTSQMLKDVFGGISGQTMTIKVICPQDASMGMVIPVMIEGISEVSMNSPIEEVKTKDMLYLVVGEQSDLDISIEQNSRSVLPNATVIFNAILTNIGNNQYIDVSINVDGKLPGWKVDLTNEPVRIFQGQTKTVPIKVRAPANSRANDKMVGNAMAIIIGSPDKRAGASFTATVEQVFGIDALIRNGRDLEMEPGETLDMVIDITNTGNGEDEITPTAYDLKGSWNLTFFNKEMFQIYHQALDYQETVSLIGRLKVPSSTRTGTYVIGINIIGNGASMVIYASIHVNQTFDVVLTTLEGKKDQSSEITPGIQRTFVYKLENKGNGMDSIKMRIGSEYDELSDAMSLLHDGWIGKFVAISNTPDLTTNIMTHDMSLPLVISDLVSDIYYTPDYTMTGVREVREVDIVLDMGHTAYIHVTLKAPYFDKGDDPGTPVMISARGIGSVDSSELLLFTLFPDLSFIQGIEISHQGNSVISEGDAVTIIVTLSNTGEISAQNVDVQLLVDGEERKVSTLRSVKNNDNDVKTVIFTWVAEPGKHELQVVIDPENTIIESQDQFTNDGEGNNNIVREIVEVEGNFIIKELINDNPFVSTLLILLLSMMILLSVSMFIKRKRQEQTV